MRNNLMHSVTPSTGIFRTIQWCLIIVLSHVLCNYQFLYQDIHFHTASPGLFVSQMTGRLLPYWLWYVMFPLLVLVSNILSIDCVLTMCTPQLRLLATATITFTGYAGAEAFVSVVCVRVYVHVFMQHTVCVCCMYSVVCLYVGMCSVVWCGIGCCLECVCVRACTYEYQLLPRKSNCPCLLVVRLLCLPFPFPVSSLGGFVHACTSARTLSHIFECKFIDTLVHVTWCALIRYG